MQKDITISKRRLALSDTKKALLDKWLQNDGRKSQSEQASAPTIFTPIKPDSADRHKPFPLTDVQQAYWVGRDRSFQLGNVASHSYQELECKGLDLDRFNLALQRLVQRHDMLRAIVLPDGMQQILETVPPYKTEVAHLRATDSEEVASILESIRQRMSHQLLKTDQWPLFEIRATRLSDDITRLHISFDILIIDVGSIRILISDLTRLYLDPDTVLPPLELSFRDYVLAQTALQNSEQYTRSQDYWLNRIKDLPPAPELPLAISPDTLSEPKFISRSSRIEKARWVELKKKAKRIGLTPSGVLMAAFAEILGYWSKSDRFTLNLTLFNRLPLHEQVNQIMGDFTTLTMLGIDTGEAETFEEKAKKIQERLWDDLDHRYFSGVKVLRELARDKQGKQGAILPIVFTSNLIDEFEEPETISQFKLGELLYSVSQTPQVWLDHQVAEENGDLVFNWDAAG